MPQEAISVAQHELDAGYSILPLTESRIPLLLPIQVLCYPEKYHESVESFSTKIQAYPHVSFICVRKDEASAVGYVVAALTERGVVPPLDSTELPVTSTPNTLYIHDLAVHPECRGRGVARALLSAVGEMQRRYELSRLALVAVNGASSFWKRMGFEVVPKDELPQATRTKLVDYGDDACFMRRIS